MAAIESRCLQGISKVAGRWLYKDKLLTTGIRYRT